MSILVKKEHLVIFYDYYFKKLGYTLNGHNLHIESIETFLRFFDYREAIIFHIDHIHINWCPFNNTIVNNICNTCSKRCEITTKLPLLREYKLKRICNWLEKEKHLK